MAKNDKKNKSTNKSLQSKIYKISGMECESCARMIELDLEDAGIASCKCSFPNQTLEVSQEDSESIILEIVKKSGYSITT